MNDSSFNILDEFNRMLNDRNIFNNNFSSNYPHLSNLEKDIKNDMVKKGSSKTLRKSRNRGRRKSINKKGGGINGSKMNKNIENLFMYVTTTAMVCGPKIDNLLNQCNAFTKKIIEATQTKNIQGGSNSSSNENVVEVIERPNYPFATDYVPFFEDPEVNIEYPFSAAQIAVTTAAVAIDIATFSFVLPEIQGGLICLVISFGFMNLMARRTRVHSPVFDIPPSL